MKPSVHIVSQSKHAAMLRDLRAREDNIISTWIDKPSEMTEMDKMKLSKAGIEEAMRADYTIVYCEPGDVLKFALVQMGAAIAAGKKVIIVGNCDSITPAVKLHPSCYCVIENIQRALLFINKI